MKFFIRIKDNIPFEHPITEENMLSVFPDIDLNNLPPEFAVFTYGTPPDEDDVGVYQKIVGTYELTDGGCVGVFTVQNKTNEEIIEKQNAVKERWANNPDAYNFTEWIFDEVTCKFFPPTPHPTPAIEPYFWQGTTSSWVLLPTLPDDGKIYRIDYASATWVEDQPEE